MSLNTGYYEKLINEAISLEIDMSEHEADLRITKDVVDPAEAPKIIAKYLENILENGFRQVEEEISDDEKKQEKLLRLANKIIDLVHDEVSTSTDDAYYASQHVVSPACQLLSVLDVRNDVQALMARKQNPARPESPLSFSSLFTGASGEPQMYSELLKEIASCDRIDILVSFIKWSGLVKIFEALKQFCRTKRLRVMTTSYMGATDAKAIEALAKLPNTEVKVSYDTKVTRLHAKAYIFTRSTGYSTAYIGSSNISHAALTTGLEWNVKITQQDQKETFAKVDATFESYWNSKDFELFTVDDLPKLKLALDGERFSGKDSDSTFLFDIQPYPFQQEILDKIEAERFVHGKYRNLVVAATGTGKTIISALDYRRLCIRSGEQPRLLFVAHREEILKQSLNCFRGVLRDPNFGELFVGQYTPRSLEHLFISIQTFNSRHLSQHIDDGYYDYIIVDEFHHAAAPSYIELLRYFKPKVLLGLTATPERMDSKDIFSFFDGRVAAEVRLPEAINRQLLCPFQYFGCTDEQAINLKDISWRNGKYDTRELDNIFTFDTVIAHKRAALILQSTSYYINDIHLAKGLGFCVSQDHARFMAEYFNSHSVPSVCLTASSSPEDRQSCQQKLIRGEINFIFVVDLYNEGVDIPAVDTILFLRPTESLTVFIQQLGRGLRLFPGKECLTILDFIAQSHKKYDFEQKFTALLDINHKSIDREIKSGFINVPRGCFIALEKQAQEYVLSNITISRGYKQRLLIMMKTFEYDTGKPLTLRNFDDEYHLNLRIFYGKCGSFSSMYAELKGYSLNDEPMMDVLIKSFPSITEINSRHWIDTLLKIFDTFVIHDEIHMNDHEIIMFQMLRCTIWKMNDYSCTTDNLIDSLKSLKSSPKMFNELIELIHLCRDRISIAEKMPNLPYECPLDVYCKYTRDQIFVALGNMKPNTVREGVKWIPNLKTDVLLVTLNKSEKNYSPTTLYDDYAISDELFHWQSQSTTSENSPTGQRYIHHRENGTHILLFVRENKSDDIGTNAYSFLGTANYVSHVGSHPMNITFHLDNQIPGNLQLKTEKLVACS